MATSTSNDDLEKISTALRKAGNATEQRSDLVAVLARDHDWGHFLTPAPLTVALLGEIMLISTDTDFKLTEKPLPPDSRLKYPESFRASLLQVTHEGYSAFNMAHNNMDKIRLYTANVPADFKEVIKILIKGSKEDVQDLLPLPLSSIRTVATQCVELAQKTERKFLSVMTLTSDLLEALVLAKGEHKNKIAEVAAMKQVVQKEEEAVAKEKSDSQEDKMSMAQAIDKAEQTWQKSMDDMPDGWGMLGAEMAGVLSESVKTVGRVLTTAVVGVFAKDSANGNENEKKDLNSPQTNQVVHEKPSGTLIFEIKRVLSLSTMAVELLKNIGKKGEKLNKKQHEVQILAQGSKQCKDQLDKLEESVCQYQALAVANKGSVIAGRLDQHLKSAIPVDKGSMKELKEIAQHMHKEAMMLNSQLTAGQGMGLSGKSLKQTQAEGDVLSQKNYDDSYAGRYLQSAQFKVEQAQANLNQWRDGYGKACDRLKETNKRHNELLGQLSKLKIDEINFDQIHKVMSNAIKQLASLREQWGTLVQFFQAMANLVEVNLSKTLTKFVKYAEQGEQKRLTTNASMSNVLLDILYETTLEAVGISHFVNMVATTYMSVSGQYIMPQISGLDKLMALDAENDRTKIQALQTKMLDECQEAQSEIAQLIATRMAEFNAYYNRRLNTVQTELRAILPPPDDDVREAVAKGIETVNDGLSEKKENEYLEDFC